MADYTPIQQNTGNFIPTTNIWDVSQLYEVDVRSPEFKELLVRLYQYVSNIAVALNNKTSSIYLKEEFVNSKQFFGTVDTSQLNLRPNFWIVVDTGAIALGANAPINIGVNFDANTKTTNIYGSASDSGTLKWYPLCFAGAAGNNIELIVSGTAPTVLTITNNSGQTFTSGIVIIEYLKI